MYMWLRDYTVKNNAFASKRISNLHCQSLYVLSVITPSDNRVCVSLIFPSLCSVAVLVPLRALNTWEAPPIHPSSIKSIRCVANFTKDFKTATLLLLVVFRNIADLPSPHLRSSSVSGSRVVETQRGISRVVGRSLSHISIPPQPLLLEFICDRACSEAYRGSLFRTSIGVSLS